MLVIDFIKSLFCKHEYEFVRNIHGDEINYMGGKRSIWKCKKCGKIQYRDELEKSLQEKLYRNCYQYQEDKYKKWCELHKETLDNMTKTMVKKSNEGFYWADFVLLCEEKYNDRNYYEKWLDDNKLKFTYELYHQKEICDEVNQYKFTIKWDKY